MERLKGYSENFVFHVGARWRMTIRGGHRLGQTLSKQDEEAIAKSPTFSSEFSRKLMQRLAEERAAQPGAQRPDAF